MLPDSSLTYGGYSESGERDVLIYLISSAYAWAESPGDMGRTRS
jgi:hypothetical protein